MGVTCQILINKKNEGIHRPGQEVTGVVKFAFDTPTEYKTITLSLLGTGECSWTESDSDNKSTRYTGSETYITSHQNITNTKTGTAYFDIGSYKYHFKFRLPEELPSSFKDSTCTIAYRIQLKFNESQFFKFNKTFATEITVYGYIDPRTEGPVIFGLDKTLLKLLATEKPVINLKAEVAKTYLSPGENAHLKITVNNNTDVEPTVWTELYCTTTYIADSGRTNAYTVKIKDCCSVKADLPKRSVTNLSQVVPTRPELYSISCKVMRKEYKLRVTLRLPFPHVNAYLEMPVLIGEREGLAGVDCAVEALEELSSACMEDPSSACVENPYSAYMEDLSSAFMENLVVDEPPSYWEVMCERKS